MFTEEKDLLLLFSDLETCDLSTSFQTIKNCSFMYSKAKSHFLSHLLVCTSKYRFKHENYIELAKMIYQEFLEFKDILFSELTRRLPPSYISDMSFNAYLIRKFVKADIFSIDDIIQYLDSIKTAPKLFFDPHFSLILFYTFLEIYQKDHSKALSYAALLKNECKNMFDVEIQNEILIKLQEIISFLSQHPCSFDSIQKMIKDGNDSESNIFSDYYYFIENGFSKDSPIEILLKDDVDKLTQLAINENFDPTCSFHVGILSKSSLFIISNLITSSADLNALKCFKFLILNQPKRIEAHNKILNNLFNHAILGGNTEIIHISETLGQFKYENALPYSIRYLRFDIFTWLFDFKVPNLSDDMKDLCSLAAATSNNFIVLETLIENGFEFNISEIEDDNVYTLIDCACFFNHETFIEILALKTNVSITKQDYQLLDRSFAAKIFKIVQSHKKVKQ